MKAIPELYIAPPEEKRTVVTIRSVGIDYGTDAATYGNVFTITLNKEERAPRRDGFKQSKSWQRKNRLK
jgi:hypothetical protein